LRSPFSHKKELPVDWVAPFNHRPRSERDVDTIGRPPPGVPIDIDRHARMDNMFKDASHFVLFDSQWPHVNKEMKKAPGVKGAFSLAFLSFSDSQIPGGAL
jgi:hypothetical protein